MWRNFTLKLVNLDTYNLVPMESVSFSALLLQLLRQSQLKGSNKYIDVTKLEVAYIAHRGKLNRDATWCLVFSK